jgi:hypothetical protein
MAFSAASLPPVVPRVEDDDSVEFGKKSGRQTRYLTVFRSGNNIHCTVTEKRGDISRQKTHFCLDFYPFCCLVNAVRWLSFDKKEW